MNTDRGTPSPATSTADALKARTGQEHPAIVLVAFGTSVPQAGAIFDRIDAAVRARYPHHDIRWAFTSGHLIRKLRLRGQTLQTPAQVIQDLHAHHHRAVALQSLHVAPGQEFQKIKQLDTLSLATAIGSPLLTCDEDLDAVTDALAGEIAPNAANVVVCHGNRTYPHFNAPFIRLAERIEARYDNTWVCSIEGQPGTAVLQQVKTTAATLGRVHFIPLMIVSGRHVLDDVLGQTEKAWQHIVAAETVTCAEPIGCNDDILAVYFRHLDAALASLTTPIEQTPTDKNA